MRRCPRCGVSKSLSEFYCRRSSGKPYGACRPCCQQSNRENWIKNKESYNATRRGWDAAQRATRALRERMNAFSVTEQQLLDLLELQGGKCGNPRCDATEPGGQGAWHLDHDHSCCPQQKRSCGHCIRGLLCSRCNVALGMVRDDPDVLLGLREYLIEYRELVSLVTQGER